MQKYKVLIDTDIGDDIDDAYALALALKLPTVEIVGVTTCFKNTVLRARIAKKLLHAAGRDDIPVYAGTATDDSTPVQFSDDMRGDEYAPDAGSAADFIATCARKYGARLIVLAIGPLSNLAEAAAQEPAVKQTTVYLMGGNYFGGKFEWNVRCAPTAAAAVFAAYGTVYAVGTDVTKNAVLSDAARQSIETRCDSPLARCLGALTARWYAKEKRPVILHDPVTLLALTHPDAFRFERQNIYVEQDGICKGLCVNFSLSAHFVPQAGSSILCAIDMDTARVIRIFSETVFGRGGEHE